MSPRGESLEPRNRQRSARVRERTEQVFNWIVAGLTTAEIARAVAKQDKDGKPRAGFWRNSDDGPVVGRRTIENYVHAANLELEELAAFNRARELGKALARMNGLFAKSLSVNDYARCNLHQKVINDLCGLNAPARQEISGPAGGPIETAAAPVDLSALTDEELETLARIRAKLDGAAEPG